MRTQMELNGKKVLVVGTGISGIAAAELLKKQEMPFVLYDGNEKLTPEDVRAKSELLRDCEVIIGEFPTERCFDFSYAVLSPGVPTDLPMVNALREKGIKIWGEIELAFAFSKGKVLAITGTNGKTTTVTLLYHLFTNLGYRCGLLSTIANYVGDRMLETANTTADPITINSLMREMVDEGCEYCFMEVSSIGMEQERVAGLDFNIGIFSNLTHDHLDYHKTFAEYLRCKKLFFDSLPASAYAVTNADDRNGMVMVQNTAAKVVTYSCRSIADHTCRIVEESFDGMQLRIDGREVWTRLIGQHNAYNLLAIYTAAVICGATEDEALLQISRLESAKGRLETLRGPKDISVIIDYAHTPDAMENVLRTLREIGPKKNIVCLFGCGGDRDKTKRPEMAAVAEKYSDRIFVTSDNSRTERTEDILEDIRKGFSPEGLARALFIADRKEAIRAAVTLSPAGSVILLAGKGHETYQIIGTEHRHFDEREIVGEVFKTMGQL